VPAICKKTLLFTPYPDLFLLAPRSFSVDPALTPGILQYDRYFFAVHEYLPDSTFVPVIFDPPFDVGKANSTVIVTFPFTGLVEVAFNIVGADGFLDLALFSKESTGEVFNATECRMMIDARPNLAIDFIEKA
jgi:hypothetical protein